MRFAILFFISWHPFKVFSRNPGKSRERGLKGKERVQGKEKEFTEKKEGSRKRKRVEKLDIFC